MSLKRTLFYFKTELSKMYSNISFGIMVLFTMIIYMTNTVYTDWMSSKKYNMFQIIFMKDKSKYLEESQVYFESVFFGTNMGYISMFAPILAAVPFVVLISNARKNTNVRFEIFRIGKKEYVTGKILSAMVCGGSIMMSGYILYGFAAAVILPGVKDKLIFDMLINNMTSIKSIGHLYDKFGITVLYAARCVEMFVYGMTSVLLTLFVSAFAHNKYMVLCIPFMINYLWSGLISKYASVNGIIQNFDSAYPSALFHIGWNDRRIVLIFWLVLLVIVLVTYYFTMGKRCDCGEG